MPINRNHELSTPVALPQASSRQPKVIQWQVVTPKHILEDLILASETYNQLLDVISYFQNRDLLFRQWGLAERFASQAGLAVNLYGPPGTGKTLAAHAIISALEMSMICVDYAEIESKYVGETSKNLSALFKTAQEQGAAIFFDEADALLSKRVTNMTSATDVSVNQTRSVLLNLLNNYQGVIIFATNFVQNFDAAFLRRIKYHVHFQLPDVELREKLWQMYIPWQMPCHVDFAQLAAKYDNISGSDIASAVFTAAVQAARFQDRLIPQSRFEQAIGNIIQVKKANADSEITVRKRFLTEEQAKAEFKLLAKEEIEK
jgi:ATP-dependent 26S proteasome regulatory subunit